MEQKDDNLELVTVLATGEEVLGSLVRGAFEEAGIPFYEPPGQMDAILGGTHQEPYNPITGPARIQVAVEDEDQAREIIRAILSESPAADEPSES